MLLSGGSPGINGGEEEGEEKSEGKKAKSDDGEGAKDNIGKDEGVPPQQGSNKKRGRGAACKFNNNGKSTTTTTTTAAAAAAGDHDGNKVGGGGESDHEIHIWTERERRKKMRNMFANLHALLPRLPPKADKSTIVDEAVNCIRNLQQTLQKLQKQKMEKLQGDATTSFNTCEPSKMNQQKVACNDDTREAFLADHQGGSSNDLVTINGSSSNINPSNNLVIPAAVSHPAPVMFQTWTSSNVVLNICGEQAHISICSPKKPGLLTAICYVLEKYKITVVSAQISSDANRSMYMIHAHHASNTGASDQFLEAFKNPVEEAFKQAVGEIMIWVSS
ncbi:hypothetical protein TIFTF001_006996 [Ficus carica]|uniref:BHLH transcription factor n=1 Tax=Ficus carica TaxID=3494 RepID=A0AA87ZP33_FICCA|nr:hypothetical protein TIFTF001_006996 [Ficus carica]